MSNLIINQEVEITLSGEVGKIIGIAEYLEWPTQYYVNYKSTEGRAVKEWFIASELKGCKYTGVLE